MTHHVRVVSVVELAEVSAQAVVVLVLMLVVEASFEFEFENDDESDHSLGRSVAMARRLNAAGPSASRS